MGFRGGRMDEKIEVDMYVYQPTNQSGREERYVPLDGRTERKEGIDSPRPRLGV
jgi:hypothetical protein